MLQPEGKYRYIGSELTLFAGAHSWRAYWHSLASPFLRGNVLEVGAGIGSATRLFLETPGISHVTSLEPDPELLARLREVLAAEEKSGRCTVKGGDIRAIEGNGTFDSVVYIDVLEHIRDDRVELDLAYQRLKKGGTLIVLAPAHQALFSPFDAAIGHCRRYGKNTLVTTAPSGLALLSVRYLDSLGLLLSLANKWVFRRANPAPFAIAFWDSRLIGASRIVDRICGYSLGKSLLAVWEKVTDD